MGRRYTETGKGWKVTASMRGEYGPASYDIQLVKGGRTELYKLSVAIKRARTAMSEDG